MASISNLQNSVQPQSKPVTRQQTAAMNRIKGIALAILAVGLFAGFTATMVLLPPTIPVNAYIVIAIGGASTTLFCAWGSTLLSMNFFEKAKKAQRA